MNGDDGKEARDISYGIQWAKKKYTNGGNLPQITFKEEKQIEQYFVFAALLLVTSIHPSKKW